MIKDKQLKDNEKDAIEQLTIKEDVSGLMAEEFNKYTSEIIRHCESIIKSKNAEYSPNEDKVANFRNAAKFSGQSMEAVLFGYLLKHWDSIKTMCLSKNQYSLSTWKEKLGDNIVYSMILFAIVASKHQENER